MNSGVSRIEAIGSENTQEYAREHTARVKSAIPLYDDLLLNAALLRMADSTGRLDDPAGSELGVLDLTLHFFGSSQQLPVHGE